MFDTSEDIQMQRTSSVSLTMFPVRSADGRYPSTHTKPGLGNSPAQGLCHHRRCRTLIGSTQTQRHMHAQF